MRMYVVAAAFLPFIAAIIAQSLENSTDFTEASTHNEHHSEANSTPAPSDHSTAPVLSSTTPSSTHSQPSTVASATPSQTSSNQSAVSSTSPTSTSSQRTVSPAEAVTNSPSSSQIPAGNVSTSRPVSSPTERSSSSSAAPSSQPSVPATGAPNATNSSSSNPVSNSTETSQVVNTTREDLSHTQNTSMNEIPDERNKTARPQCFPLCRPGYQCLRVNSCPVIFENFLSDPFAVATPLRDILPWPVSPIRNNCVRNLCLPCPRLNPFLCAGKCVDSSPGECPSCVTCPVCPRLLRCPLYQCLRRDPQHPFAACPSCQPCFNFLPFFDFARF